MISEQIKLCVYDKYYKNIDNVVTYLKNNNKIKSNYNNLFKDFESINAIENRYIQTQKDIFENILGSRIKLIKSKIVYLDTSLKLDDNNWFAVIFLTDSNNRNNAIKFLTKDNRGEDFVLGKKNRLVFFNNMFCKEIMIIEKVLIEIVKIELN